MKERHSLTCITKSDGMELKGLINITSQILLLYPHNHADKTPKSLTPTFSATHLKQETTPTVH